MNKLQCELCGGSLLMDDSGDFAECESCGMRFKRETIRKMMVELSGPVQVEGIANISNLLARAKDFEKNGDFQKAQEYYDKVLDLDVTNTEAKERLDFLKPYKAGDVVIGTVSNIVPIGAFVQLPNGSEGMIHISKLDNRRVNRVEEVVSIGDTVRVKVMDFDDHGRINLSRRDALEQ